MDSQADDNLTCVFLEVPPGPGHGEDVIDRARIFTAGKATGTANDSLYTLSSDLFVASEVPRSFSRPTYVIMLPGCIPVIIPFWVFS